MITRTKKLIKGFLNETEAEKAARRFFGTFVKDIKRWGEMGMNGFKKIKRKTDHDVTKLTYSLRDNR